MAGKPKAARVKKWNGGYYLFYYDHFKKKAIRRKCTELGAFNYVQRQELAKRYQDKEELEVQLAKHAEVEKEGRGEVEPQKVCLLTSDLKMYLEMVDNKTKIRFANPGAHLGISISTQKLIQQSVGHFQTWIDTNFPDLSSQELSIQQLSDWVEFVILEGTKPNEDKAPRSSATINRYIRYLKTALKWVSKQQPRRFEDRELLLDELKPQKGKSAKKARSFSADILKTFLETAIRFEHEDHVTIVHRVKNGLAEEFELVAPSTSATPVSRLFILLALTGARRGEILKLRWEDVDLKRGRITIIPEKTNNDDPCIPLTGAPEGEIAPRLTELLRLWYAEDPKRKFVLPHAALEKPVFPKKAWQRVVSALEMDGPSAIGPQRLRSNFTSYAASLGVPASVAAMWQGHSSIVAEKNYRRQILDRVADAHDFEEAMGLDKILDEMIGQGVDEGPKRAD